MKEAFVIATKDVNGRVFTTKHYEDEAKADPEYTIVAKILKQRKGTVVVGKNPHKAKVVETDKGLFAVYNDWSAVAYKE